MRGALGSQARIGEVRELQVGFEFRRIQTSPDPTQRFELELELELGL